MIEQDTETGFLIKALIVIWFILLIPWVPLALLSGMAFDGGSTVRAYIFVWSTLTYPVAVAVAVYFRRKVPLLVAVPCINVLCLLLSGLGRSH
jgi:hypothetical protein